MGGAIARHLAECGCEVVGLSRNSATSLPRELVQVQRNIATATREELAAELPKCDAVVHAAACLDFNDSAQLLATNKQGTNTIAQLARWWRCHHFVYISSVAVYGVPKENPVNERHPADPQSLYAMTKRFGEQCTGSLEPFMHALSVRIPSPIGPGLGARRIVGTFLERALAGEPLVVHGRGGRRQNYLDVRDIARAVAAGLNSTRSGVLQVGALAAVSNLALAQCIVATVESTSPIVFSGVPDPDEHVTWELDCTRARKWLGWAPEYGLDDSIRTMAGEIRGESA